MTAKPAKPAKPASAAQAGDGHAAGLRGGRPAAARPSSDVEAERSFFRVGAAATDNLGAPTDPPPSVPVPAPGLIGRLLHGAPRPKPVRRRQVAAREETVATPGAPKASESVDAAVVESAVDAAVGPEAVDSYRSASDLADAQTPSRPDVVA